MTSMENKQTTTNATDLIFYREFVWMLAHGGENGQGLNRQFMNSDKEKALIVLVELFRSAIDTVRIFAANLCQNVGTESEYVEAGKICGSCKSISGTIAPNRC